jgi:hypothetical protein
MKIGSEGDRYLRTDGSGLSRLIISSDTFSKGGLSANDYDLVKSMISYRIAVVRDAPSDAHALEKRIQFPEVLQDGI